MRTIVPPPAGAVLAAFMVLPLTDPSGLDGVGQAVPIAGGDQVLVLGVPLDVARDEGAERSDLEALPAHVLERRCGQPAAEAAARALFVDLRVRERDPAVPAVVGRDPDQPLAETKLVAGCLGDVEDDRVLRRGRDRLGWFGRAEVVDKLAGRVGLARVPMIEEPLPMRSGVLAGPELTQVAVDLACSAEEATVLGLESRNLVRAGDRPQLGSLLRPGRDLASDEVEIELGENLADGGGERAPLGLVERQHPSALEAVRLVRAVAERPVARSAAATERGPLALVEDVAVGVEDADAAPEEEWAAGRGANLERLRTLRQAAAEPPRAQRPGRAARDGRLDLVGRSRVGLHPGPSVAIEHLRQPLDAVQRVVAEARLPLDHDLVARVLLHDRIPARGHLVSSLSVGLPPDVVPARAVPAERGKGDVPAEAPGVLS